MKDVETTTFMLSMPLMEFKHAVSTSRVYPEKRKTEKKCLSSKKNFYPNPLYISRAHDAVTGSPYILNIIL